MSFYHVNRSIAVLVLCLAATVMIQPLMAAEKDGDWGKGFNLITSVPRTMSYQGNLKDSGGNPVTDSVYSVTFRIFNVASGGTSLWDETLPCTTSAGFFSTLFGNVNLPFDEDYWLELEIDSEILVPRQKMNMVGYAAVSDTADYAFATVAGGDGWIDDGTVVRLETISDSVGIGTTSPSGKLHVSTDGIYSGYFTSDHLSGSTHIVHAEYTGPTGSAGPKAVYGKAVPEDGDGWGGYFEGGYRGVQGTVMPTGSEDYYAGVVGYIDGGSGSNTGVYGSATNGNENRGIIGEATGSGAQNIGVYGTAQGATVNWAGYFYGDVRITGKATIGPGQTNTGTNAFVAGRDNTASNDEAFVAGQNNIASGFRSAISGGDNHIASGMRATIGGGMNSSATGHFSTVGGGDSDTASGTWSTIGGGYGNRADDSSSTVSGGHLNTADGIYSAVGGGNSNSAMAVYGGVASGYSNLAGDNVSDTAAFVAGGFDNSAIARGATVGGGYENTSSQEYTTVSGGLSNSSSGDYATVGGGSMNTAGGGGGSTVAGGGYNIAYSAYSAVGGGAFNRARGPFSVVSGGGGGAPSDSNAAIGNYSTVPGGNRNIAGGNYSFAAGRRAKANHDGAFVWADQTNADFASTGPDQFLIRASGGVGIGTTNPTYRLDVEGTVGIDIGSNFNDVPLTIDVPANQAALISRTVKGGSIINVVDNNGNVGIGTFSPQGALDVNSTTGAFIVPRMTTAQRDALTAINGMIVYNTTTNQFNFYENGAWVTK